MIKKIEKSIDELCTEFELNPTKFYTENDIVTRFRSILDDNLGVIEVGDKDDNLHSIIHCEYPTPFRCSMKDNKFIKKTDNDRTGKGGKYRRGHYDFVIMNANFIKEHTYTEIKSQNYKLYKEVLKNMKSTSVIMYGFEFMFSRDKIKPSRGKNKDKAINNFVAKVKQDYDKLCAGKEQNGFMECIKMMVFINGNLKDVDKKIEEKLLKFDEIDLIIGHK